MTTQSFVEQVVGHRDRLFGYARKLSGSRMLAEDIVQETILKALLHSDQFKPGTNLSAWLCAITRNAYFNELRTARRYSSIDEGDGGKDKSAGANQLWSIELKEVSDHFDALPHTQRDALNLVAIEGNSYEAAAEQVGCACGTMKSRVSRARTALADAINASPLVVPGGKSRKKKTGGRLTDSRLHVAA
jgi:RNA polymerase sigma-70 factor (ECF subfamily)